MSLVMNDWTHWSISLGKWSGVNVRLHLFFVLLGIVVVALAPNLTGDGMAVVSLWMLVVLFASNLFHELGHVLAIVRLGGDVDRVVLCPIGGATRCDVPPSPENVWVASLAGPAANLLLSLVAACLLAIVSTDAVLGLFDLITPQAITEGSTSVIILKLTVWLNWLLAVINLLPAFPFDGGTALRAALRPVVGSRSAAVYVFRTAVLVSISLLIAAWLLRNAYVNASLPAWLPLAMLATFLLFSARRDVEFAFEKLPEEQFFDDVFSELDDYLHFEDVADEGVLIESYLQPSVKEENEPIDREATEEARLDDVLARLHGSSLAQLSAEDRMLLEEASKKYQGRLESDAKISDDD